MTQHTQESLLSFTVPQIRALVREHNLHNTIRGYSKMNKADIIDSFLKHQQTKKPCKVVKKPLKKPTKKHTKEDKDSPALESAKEYHREVVASNQQHEFIYSVLLLRCSST
jgi:hypothetical protein